MNYYLNLKNGQVSINTWRLPEASLATVEDVIAAKEAGGGCLTANLNVWIKEKAEKIMSIAETCKSQAELNDFVMGEGDFLELFLEREFGIDLADYPDLRDLQRSQFEHIEFSAIEGM